MLKQRDEGEEGEKEGRVKGEVGKGKKGGKEEERRRQGQ